MENNKKVFPSNPGRNIFAICGKGGVGKTAFSAMLTKVLLERGNAGKLLVIDADPALGLSNTLDIHIEKTMGQVRESIISSAKSEGDTDLVETVGKIDYMVMEALVETDNFAVLAMGRTDSRGCFCSVNSLLRDAVKILSQKFDTIIIDGEAGLEQINRQVMENLDCLIVLTDASARGVQVVEMLKDMVENKNVIHCKKIGVIFNGVQGKEDFLTQSAEKIGIDVFGFVPHDSNVRDYDMMGKPLIALPEHSEALTAVRGILQNLGYSDA